MTFELQSFEIKQIFIINVNYETENHYHFVSWYGFDSGGLCGSF
jgi:hypothetical protein